MAVLKFFGVTVCLAIGFALSVAAYLGIVDVARLIVN